MHKRTKGLASGFKPRCDSEAVTWVPSWAWGVKPGCSPCPVRSVPSNHRKGYSGLEVSAGTFQREKVKQTSILLAGPAVPHLLIPPCLTLQDRPGEPRRGHARAPWRTGQSRASLLRSGRDRPSLGPLLPPLSVRDLTLEGWTQREASESRSKVDSGLGSRPPSLHWLRIWTQGS